MNTIQTLDELARVLREEPDTAETAERHGLPRDGDRIDWTSLPTFGGSEPRNTAGVWSWDDARLLLGRCAADLEIVTRQEWEETP